MFEPAKNCSKTAAEISWISFHKCKKKLSNSLIKSSWFMLGPLVDSCFLSTQQMSKEVTHVFEIKKKMRENEAFENWIWISTWVKKWSSKWSPKWSQKKVNSYHLGWHFQICCQKIVGKWFFTIFGHNKDKNITLFDTNCFKMLLLS